MQSTNRKYEGNNKKPNGSRINPSQGFSSLISESISRIDYYFSKSYRSAYLDILELDQKTENYQTHKPYSDCKDLMDQVNLQCTDVFSQLFNTHLDSDLKTQQQNEDQVLNFHTTELSIIDEKELEHQLKLESAFNKARDDYHKMLIRSGIAFNQTIANKQIHKSIRKIRPGSLALVIQDALNTTLKNNSASRMAYRFLGWRFFLDLSELYSALHQPLNQLSKSIIEEENSQNHHISHDMISHDKSSHANPTTSDKDQTASEPLPFDSSTFPSDERSTSLNDTAVIDQTETKIFESNPQTEIKFADIDFDNVINSLNVPATRNGDGSYSEFTELDMEMLSVNSRINEINNIQASDLLKELTNKLKENPELTLKTEDIKQGVRSALSKLSGNEIITVLDRVSENVLNLVSHLFSEIIESEYLIDEVACQIYRVQVPVMQVALTDTKMFQTEDHPVRQYLNILGELGIKISNADEEGYYKIKQSIDTLIEEFDNDLSTFEIQSTDLSNYLKNSIYSFRQPSGEFDIPNIETNGANTYTTQEFLDAQDAMLNNRLAIHRLMRQIWEVVLTKISSTVGIYSKKWFETTEIYSIVFWSTQSDSTAENISEIIIQLPKIVKGLKTIFDNYSIDKKIESVIFESLIQIHLQILKGTNGRDITEHPNQTLDLFKCIKDGVILSQSTNQSTKQLTEDTCQTVEIWSDTTIGRNDNKIVRLEELSSNNFANAYDNIGTIKFDQMGDFGETAELSFLDPRDNLLTPSEKPVDTDDESVSETEERPWDNTAIALTTSARHPDAPQEIKAEQIAQAYAQISRLSLGTLFEITEAGKSNRYHLFQKSIVQNKYTFQNILTQNMLVLTGAELATKLTQEKAIRLHPNRLFDNTLEKVVGTISMGNDSIKTE